jgi:hypothetical protein
MDACTENYECLVLDNTSKSNDVTNCVFWYKAALRKNFRCGSSAFWQFHQRNYNPKHSGTSLPGLVRKPGASVIQVKKLPPK